MKELNYYSVGFIGIKIKKKIMLHFSVLFVQIAKQPPPLLGGWGEFKREKVQSFNNYKFLSFVATDRAFTKSWVDLSEFSLFTTAQCLEEVNTVYQIEILLYSGVVIFI